MARIAVDFDEVIHHASNPKVGRRMGPPVVGSLEALTFLKSKGHEVVIFTVWPPDRHQTIRDWMGYYHLPYDRISNVKEAMDVYIDDKAIHFSSWSQTLQDLAGFISL